VSKDKQQDGAAIEEAAQNAANRALPPFQAAVKHAKEYTKLDGNAFGIVPSIALKPPYEKARTSQVKNLEDGLKKLKAMINGLATVAYNMHSAEAGNTITPNRDALKIKVKPPEVDGSSNFGAIPAAFGFGYGLPGWLACHCLKLSFTPLCAAAAVSSIMWLSVMPDDVEIDKAISAWVSVGTELNTIGQLSQVLSLSEDAWDDDARTAFNAWVNNFQTELDSAIAMAAGAEPGEGVTPRSLKTALTPSSSFKTSCSALTSPAWQRWSQPSS
jgi:hypothetical protein